MFVRLRGSLLLLVRMIIHFLSLPPFPLFHLPPGSSFITVLSSPLIPFNCPSMIMFYIYVLLGLFESEVEGGGGEVAVEDGAGA